MRKDLERWPNRHVEAQQKHRKKINILNSLLAVINENKRYRAGIGEEIVYRCL